jgi:hypothetical protein
MARKKNRPLPPRHKRLNRPRRLQAAESWIKSYTGKNIARGYSKHFAVDAFCAIRELRILGVSIDPAYEHAVLSSRVAQARKKRADSTIVSEFRTQEEDYYGFAFIAGYTAGGAPYGITNEEMEPSF